MTQQYPQEHDADDHVRRRPLLLPIAAVLLLLFGGLGVFIWRTSARGADLQGMPLATLSAGDFHSLVFVPGADEVVLFGHHNGMMRSEDGGRTWKPLVEQRNFDAMSIIVRETQPLQIATAGHESFHASWDGGETWKQVVHDLPGNDIHGLVMNPDRPAQLTVYVVDHGLFESPDGGQSWRKLPGEPAAVKDTMTLASAGGDPQRLYLGTLRSGLWRSQDGGATWAEIAPAAELGGVLALAIDPATRTTMYAGTDRGLFASSDGGVTWTALPYPGQNAAVVALHPRRPSLLLAISVSENGTGLLYRSEDGGLTWSGAR